MVQSVSLAESTGPGAPKSFAGKLAVVTGGGSGMGRELVRQLAAAGCSVAVCDWREEAVAETAAMARAGAPPAPSSPAMPATSPTRCKPGTC